MDWVFIVHSKSEGILSVCKDEQTAEWERNLFEMEDYKDVEIYECSVIFYDKEYYDKQMDVAVHNRFPLIKDFAKAIHEGVHKK